MKSKKELIDEYLRSPLLIGQKMIYKNDKGFNKMGILTELTSSHIKLKDLDSGRMPTYRTFTMEEYHTEGLPIRDTSHIGYNPMQDTSHLRLIKVLQFSFESIMIDFGYRRDGTPYKDNSYGEDWKDVERMNWNPKIIDKNGIEHDLQRGFEWELKHKQLLVDSVYNSRFLGSILVRVRSSAWIDRQAKSGKYTAFKEVIDGKQRVSTLIEFIQDKFLDAQGRKFSDFSKNAQREFMKNVKLNYSEISETATDEQVAKMFLSLNIGGIPVSDSHINTVEAIQF